MMEWVMCRACGEFVGAAKEGDEFVPIKDSCPDCGGAEFKDIDSGTIIRADD